MAEPDRADPLSTKEIEQVQRLLSSPLHFPSEFKSWVSDWLATNIPQIPISQAFGGRGVPRFLSADTTHVSTVATTYTQIYSVKVPGKRLAENGQLQILLYYTALCPDVSNTVALTVEINGAQAAYLQELDCDNHLDGTARDGMWQINIFNLGSYASQGVAAFGSFDAQAGPTPLGGAGSASADTTQDFTVTVSAIWGDAGGQDFDKYYASTQIFNPIGF